MSAATDTLHWSDPFEQLAVGQSFHTPERPISATDVVIFSALTGDWHPQHSDPAWAAHSPFGEQIAHGMLTLSIAVGLVPLDPERVLALRRVGDVVFKHPVRLGDSIHVQGNIKTLIPVDDHAGLVELNWAIRNQDRVLVCRASVGVLWRRAVQAPTGPSFWHEPASAPPDEFQPIPL